MADCALARSARDTHHTRSTPTTMGIAIKSDDGPIRLLHPSYKSTFSSLLRHRRLFAQPVELHGLLRGVGLQLVEARQALLDVRGRAVLVSRVHVQENARGVPGQPDGLGQDENLLG